MLVLLEVYLSIRAWNAGWKGWTFAAWICCLLLAFCGGIVLGLSGAAVDNLFLMGWLVGDLPLIVVLFLMSKHPRPPKSATLPELSLSDEHHEVALR
jgi:hypothetical protein